ncbi:tRNA pseudouridine synthase A [Acidobacteria bacterium AB60]|nr:tRNA pseudouridine synthase A [Acidobacteria bacterium AB60]
MEELDQNGRDSASTDVVRGPQAGPRNWKLTLAYDGTEYHGWQVQPGLPTIQGELQAALGRVTRESPLPQGSGRTDAGVHALAQVASFVLEAGIPGENLLRALNRTLPAAIRVLEARVVEPGFHARHSTVAKTYEYRVYGERQGQGPRDEDQGRIASDAGRGARVCPPFLARYVYAYPWPLDLQELQRAADLFVGTHDFLSFAATDPDLGARSGEAARPMAGGGSHEEAPSGAPELSPRSRILDEDGKAGSAVRTIFASGWETRETADGLLLVYRVRGEGFLHHMVRNLVGTMLDAGRGYRRAEEIPDMIAARSRAAAGPTAPARGLFLHSVEY